MENENKTLTEEHKQMMRNFTFEMAEMLDPSGLHRYVDELDKYEMLDANTCVDLILTLLKAHRDYPSVLSDGTAVPPADLLGRSAACFETLLCFVQPEVIEEAQYELYSIPNPRAKPGYYGFYPEVKCGNWVELLQEYNRPDLVPLFTSRGVRAYPPLFERYGDVIEIKGDGVWATCAHEARKQAEKDPENYEAYKKDYLLQQEQREASWKNIPVYTGRSSQGVKDVVKLFADLSQAIADGTCPEFVQKLREERKMLQGNKDEKEKTPNGSLSKGNSSKAAQPQPRKVGKHTGSKRRGGKNDSARGMGQ